MRFLARDSLIHCKLIQFCIHTAGDLSQLLDPDMRLKFGEELEDGGAKRAAANMSTTLVRFWPETEYRSMICHKHCDHHAGGGAAAKTEAAKVCRCAALCLCPFQNRVSTFAMLMLHRTSRCSVNMVQCCCPESVQEAVRSAGRPGKAPTLRLLICELMHRHAMKHVKHMKHIHCDARTCRAAVRERRRAAGDAATVAQKPSSLKL